MKIPLFQVDAFTSRVFGGNCTLVPYWAARLGKDRLRALQVSARGGELFCEQRGDRVLIAGRAVPFLSGTIELPR